MSSNMNSERLYRNKYLDEVQGSFSLDPTNELISLRALILLAVEDYDPKDPDTVRMAWRTLRNFAYVSMDITKLRATLTGQALVQHIIGRMQEVLPSEIRGPAVLQFRSLLDQAVFASDTNVQVRLMDDTIPCGKFGDDGIPDHEEDPAPDFFKPEIVPELVVPPFITKLGDNVGFKFMQAWRKADPAAWSIGEEIYLSRQLSARTLTHIIAMHDKYGSLHAQLMDLYLSLVKVTFQLLRCSMKGIEAVTNHRSKFKSFIRDQTVEQIAVQVCEQFGLDAYKLGLLPKNDLGNSMTDLLPDGSRTTLCGSECLPPLRLIQ